jgi:hypothetical protein
VEWKELEKTRMWRYANVKRQWGNEFKVWQRWLVWWDDDCSCTVMLVVTNTHTQVWMDSHIHSYAILVLSPIMPHWQDIWC